MVIPCLIGITVLYDLVYHQVGQLPETVSLIGILGAIFLSFGILRLWSDSSKQLILGANICALPLVFTPICGFLGLGYVSYASVNILVVYGTIIAQFFVLRRIFRLPLLAAVIFSFITLLGWGVSQKVLSKYAINPVLAPPVWVQESNVDSPYHSERNTFLAKPQEWFVSGTTEEITEVSHGKEFTVLRLLLEDTLNSYANKEDGQLGYYKFHPMLLRFRNTDAGALKWDSFKIHSTFSIKSIKARKGLAMVEYTVEGKQTIEPRENSAISNATIRPFSYTLTLYKTQPNRWEVYYARNNKISK